MFVFCHLKFIFHQSFVSLSYCPICYCKLFSFFCNYHRYVVCEFCQTDTYLSIMFHNSGPSTDPWCRFILIRISSSLHKSAKKKKNSELFCFFFCIFLMFSVCWIRNDFHFVTERHVFRQSKYLCKQVITLKDKWLKNIF